MKFAGMFALVAALVLSVASPLPTHAQTAGGTLFTCSMHPGVAEARAGKCPVCSMTLKARPMTPAEQSVADFFKAYDAAFIAKDLEKLGAMYTADTTVFEGGGVNDGWADYRDKHLGPELKASANLKFSHSDIVPHMMGTEAAYVTAEYTISSRTADVISNGGGLATYLLVKQNGAWKIKHTHTSAKKR